MLSVVAAAALTCKAVLAPAMTRGCRSIEFDLNITPDGVLVLSHEPVDRPWSAVKGELLDLDSFVDGLKGRSFDMVDLDLKERSVGLGDGRLSRAFARHEQALRALAERTEHLVFSTPVPPRYAEVERFLKRSGVRGEAGYELADYDGAEARRWGLPLSWWDSVLLPAGRVLNAAYRRLRGSEIKTLVMQESTAAALPSSETATVICWSRDPVAGPPPAACRWDERALP